MWLKKKVDFMKYNNVIINLNNINKIHTVQINNKIHKNKINILRNK
jgi:hypothetical protein